ncbi:hypothetical protein NARC_50097 [Candidatus Nitrosocosmicus arcticus]|uniref:Uncharacterized protein n=1 Tax=Candidatus Nitrosocosmicus arcticus TaxID=2035267 RepID=A0A557SWD6_9ARCH|nr:hypothetical protein NARC_50097 [Candidatus Nitrosocosmicus arcticus]
MIELMYFINPIHLFIPMGSANLVSNTEGINRITIQAKQRYIVYNFQYTFCTLFIFIPYFPYYKNERS